MEGGEYDMEENIQAQISELESLFFTLNKHEVKICYDGKPVVEEDLANLEIEKDKNLVVTLNILPEHTEEEITMQFKND